MTGNKKVLVIGGGYGGIRAIEKLVGCEGIDITLIDQNSYHYLQTDVYDYIAGRTGLSEIAVDLFTLCAGFEKPVSFFQEEVLRIDCDNKSVTTNHCRHHYDYLIIAAGSRTLMPESIAGLADHFHGVKSLPNALRFKQRFEECMYKRLETEGKCSLESRFNIVVGGGGLSGVEIAAEMVAYAQEFFKDIGYLCGGVNVTLINSSDALLKGTSSFFQTEARKRLESLGIKIVWNRRILEVKEDKVLLDNGETMAMNFLIWTGGITPPWVIRDFEVAKNGKGQLSIDEYCRLVDYPEVFAIGDCADLKDPISGKTMPPTAQSAELSAAYVAKNLRRLLRNEPMRTEPMKFQGMFAALGGKVGCGEALGRFRFKGYMAYLMKKVIEKSYYWPLRKRCKKGYKIMTEGR